MIYATPSGKRRYDPARATRLRDKLNRRDPSVVARLTRQTLLRLIRPGANGSLLQREWRESVSLAPFRRLFPRLTRWSQRNFRAQVEAVLPLYVYVFSDSAACFSEFATELTAHESEVRQLRDRTKLVQQLIVLMAESVVSSMNPRGIRDTAARASRRLISLCDPTLATRLHNWMDFIELIDGFLQHHREEPFFGVEFLLSDDQK